MRNVFPIFIILLFLVAPFLPSGGTGRGAAQEANVTTPGAAPAAGNEDTIRPYVIPEGGPFHPEQIAIENSRAIADWHRSGHANAASASFSHWDEEGAIPPNCSVCHAGAGFRAFHGLDGSEPGLPAEPVPIGGVVDCQTCHDPGLSRIEQISLPSGVSHPVQGVEAACLTCHQGRASGQAIEAAIGDAPEDRPNPDLRFINPHYATAAATWLGGYGGAGYHYAGRDYSGRFFHARPIGTCASCHEPHSLEVATETCLTCHQSGDPEEIRISRHSYDGSGDTSVGIHSDIQSNARLLMKMMKDYSGAIAGTPLVYDGHSYPYFFADANGDGVADTADGRAQAYASWTPRLLRAAYNWKLVTADPGAYVHNPPYALELLHDSIADLAGPLEVDMDSLGLLR
ncbi:cytochrome c3 family protein [Roseivivax sediminis]|uniref:Uncharacterized protein n=1 Tax=Roseivivax sediminis TaxID=936889 RepID=A0A1I1VUD7_9RHOB|nr:cytochrome C [Roseivivax sediminis]SFD84693.1 hypothetical protein SAMN04515678_103321 [Roseivivax sediminis]